MTLAELQFVGAGALIFVPLERLIPLHRENRTFRPGLVVDLLHLSVSGFLIRAGIVATLFLLGVAVSPIVPDGVPETIRRQPSWLQFIQLLLLSDFCFYAAHRLVHTVPWLWRFHAVHHSSEQMDWLATFRVHPLDQILNSTIIAAPAMVLGFSPGSLLAFALLYRAHAMLLHSNVRLDFGRAGRVFASPQYHHWHHADEPQAYNMNFGGQLVIWDILFGTYYDSSALPKRYGVRDTVPAGYVLQLLQPLLPDRGRRGASLAPADGSSVTGIKPRAARTGQPSG